MKNTELKENMELLNREVDCCDQLSKKATVRIEKQIQETKERRISKCD
jgi:hypothetical protein